MERENSDLENKSFLDSDEYDEIFQMFYSYTINILCCNGIHLDCNFKSDMLKDALTEAFVMYDQKNIKIDAPIAFKHWICKTAYNIFRNHYKQYKQIDFCDNCNFDSISQEYINQSYRNLSWLEIKEHLTGYCLEEDIEFLQKYWYEGYSFKEMSFIYEKSEAALKQRHKRLLDKLRKILPTPLNN